MAKHDARSYRLYFPKGLLESPDFQEGFRNALLIAFHNVAAYDEHNNLHINPPSSIPGTHGHYSTPHKASSYVEVAYPDEDPIGYSTRVFYVGQLQSEVSNLAEACRAYLREALHPDCYIIEGVRVWTNSLQMARIRYRELFGYLPKTDFHVRGGNHGNG